MRIVDIDYVREGMITGYNVENENGILLPKHSVLTSESIDLIKTKRPDKKRLWVLDIAELKPALYQDSTMVTDLIEFLIKKFKEVFKTSILQPDSLNILIKKVSQFMYVNRVILYECICLRNKHEYTYNHSMNVAMYSMLIGIRLGLEDLDLQYLLLGCILHDIGKIHISENILDKPDKLTEAEFMAIKQHPLYGLDLMRNSNCVNNRVLNIISQHHEKLNGQGYPFGLVGDSIDFLAQITTVADIFDAVTSERSYHEKRPPYAGIDVLNSEVERGRVNKKCVDILASEIILFTTGQLVMLSNGEIAEVLESCLTIRPLVYSLNSKEIYDLAERKDLCIVDCI